MHVDRWIVPLNAIASPLKYVSLKGVIPVLPFSMIASQGSQVGRGRRDSAPAVPCLTNSISSE